LNRATLSSIKTEPASDLWRIAGGNTMVAEQRSINLTFAQVIHGNGDAFFNLAEGAIMTP